MRVILGFLSGVLGMLAGWVGLAALIITIAGEDRDGGTAMGAFFNIGPIGAVLGFAAGVILFLKIGLVAQPVGSPEAMARPAAAASAKSRISRPFAAIVFVTVAGLCWWGWYEFIRSPYLSHGFMTLELHFRLPPKLVLPADEHDVHINVTDGTGYADAYLTPGWRGHDGNHAVILANVSISDKTRDRMVTLSLPGMQEQTWTLDLASDPDPTPDFSPWRLSDEKPADRIEMSFQLTADH
jgi:MFS family permease